MPKWYADADYSGGLCACLCLRMLCVRMSVRPVHDDEARVLACARAHAYVCVCGACVCVRAHGLGVGGVGGGEC